MSLAEKYSSPDMNDWNRQIIEEFHARAGKVGDRLRGQPCSCSPPREPGAANAARCL